MPSSPWAQAVEAGRAARHRLSEQCAYWWRIDRCCCPGEIHGQPAQDAAFLRAALPHLLRAVVEALREGGVWALERNGRLMSLWQSEGEADQARRLAEDPAASRVSHWSVLGDLPTPTAALAQVRAEAFEDDVADNIEADPASDGPPGTAEEG